MNSVTLSYSVFYAVCILEECLANILSTSAGVLSIHFITLGDVFKHFVTLPGYIFFTLGGDVLVHSVTLPRGVIYVIFYPGWKVFNALSFLRGRLVRIFLSWEKAVFMHSWKRTLCIQAPLEKDIEVAYCNGGFHM